MQRFSVSRQVVLARRNSRDRVAFRKQIQWQDSPSALAEVLRMPIVLRARLLVTAALSISSVVTNIAYAQGNQRGAEAYPSRPIRLVVPFAPGGSSDTITRLIGPKMAEQLGQQVVL